MFGIKEVVTTFALQPDGTVGSVATSTTKSRLHYEKPEVARNRQELFTGTAPSLMALADVVEFLPSRRGGCPRLGLRGFSAAAAPSSPIPAAAVVDEVLRYLSLTGSSPASSASSPVSFL